MSTYDVSINSDIFIQRLAEQGVTQVDTSKTARDSTTTNPTLNRPSASCFVVCPKSGLSYTIHADWNANVLANAIHPDAHDYMKMARTIRSHLRNVPNTYIAAFCQVWARDNGLLLDSHKAYASGYITESLAKIHRTKLIELFWVCYNSTSGLAKYKLKINLDDAKSPTAIYDLFMSVASQSVDELRHLSSRSEYRPRLKGKLKTTQHKMDIDSCIKRVAKLLPKLANANPSNEIEISSARRAAGILPRFSIVRTDVKNRVLEIMDSLFTWAISEDFYTTNSLQYQSYEIVRKHIAENLVPVELEEVEF